jgi:hypothetical protein
VPPFFIGSIMPKTLYIGEDNDVTWPAKLATTEALLTTGTVTMVLKDADGNSVTLASGSLTYNSTLGKWVGVVDEDAALTEDAAYTLEVTGAFSGADAFRKIECVAKYHGER